mgnify:CR=1 FL=1
MNSAKAVLITFSYATLGMLAMFLSDELVRSVADKLSDGVNAYVFLFCVV